MTEFFRQLFGSLAAMLIIAVVLVLEWHWLRRCFIKVPIKSFAFAWLYIRQFFLAGAIVMIAVLGFYFYDWIVFNHARKVEVTKAMILFIFTAGIIFAYSCMIVASWVSEKQGVWSAWIKKGLLKSLSDFVFGEKLSAQRKV